MELNRHKKKDRDVMLIAAADDGSRRDLLRGVVGLFYKALEVQMLRVCDLFEAVPLNRCEALNFATIEVIQTRMRAALSATDRARALISMIGAAGEFAIQVAFERDAIREPPHEMGCKRAMEILRAVSTGVM